MSTTLFGKKYSRSLRNNFSTRIRGFPKFYFCDIAAIAAEFAAKKFQFSRRRKFFGCPMRGGFLAKTVRPRNAEKIDRILTTRHSMIKDETRCGQKTSRGYFRSVMSGRGDNLRVERSWAGKITSLGATSETRRMARAFHMKLERSTTNFLSGRAESKMLS